MIFRKFKLCEPLVYSGFPEIALNLRADSGSVHHGVEGEAARQVGAGCVPWDVDGI